MSGRPEELDDVSTAPGSAVQLYEPFFADFGPLNLGRTFRFCQQTKQLLQVRPAPVTRALVRHRE